MKSIIEGKVVTLGKNIDTDQIYPGRFLDITDPQLVANHCFKGLDQTLRSRIKPGTIVVANTNFGCGSSREHAAITLKQFGIPLVIASSFARIFYRNAFNLGLPLLICPNIMEHVSDGDELQIDLNRSTILNNRTSVIVEALPIEGFSRTLLENDGIKSYYRNKIGS